jgi:hypothetical protein
VAAHSELLAQPKAGAGIQVKLPTCEGFITLPSYSFGRHNLIIKEKRSKVKERKKKKASLL